MIAAVMQPYLFPYLGYYQLAFAVDKFVLYDDVNFIKRGYINRNNILVDGKAQRFTIAVPGNSQNKTIKSLEFSGDTKKFLTTIKHAYCKAPCFDSVYRIIEEVIKDNDRSISNICYKSIRLVFEYLGIKKDLLLSSELDYNLDASAADRLIDITKRLGCSQYINSIGGTSLYEKRYFEKYGVTLNFISMYDISYPQNINGHVPNLSIIDVLMWNNKENVRSLLTKYELI